MRQEHWRCFSRIPIKGNNCSVRAIDNYDQEAGLLMLHLRRKLLMLLIASLVFVLLPAASALAGGLAPAGPGSFTIESIQRNNEEGCSSNDTSRGNSIIAHVFITHQAGKTFQVAGTTENLAGEEITYVGETYVKSEEVQVGIRLSAVYNFEKPESQLKLTIGPWVTASFKFYESGYEVGVGEGNNQIEPCSGSDQSLITKEPTIVSASSGKSVLINVLEKDSSGLEVIAVSKPYLEAGWSNDPNNGRVFIENNEIRYTPPAQTKNYRVILYYSVSNGKWSWAEGVVYVNVSENNEPTPKPPVVVDPDETFGPVYVVPPALLKGGGPSEVVKSVPQKGGAPYDLTLSRKAHISHGVVSVILTCREHIECSGLLNLILGNRVVGVYRYSVGYGSWTIKIKLTKAAARSLKKTNGRKLSLVASATCCRKLTVVLEH